MASIQDGGIRIFSVELDTASRASIVESQEELEDLVNNFLNGGGTVDEPLKLLVSSQFTVDETNNTLYVAIQYKRVN